MLKEKETIVTYITNKCEQKISLDKGNVNKVVSIMKETFNIPTGEATDMISGRVDLMTSSDFMLFALLTAMDTVLETHKVKLYFTPIEIKEYSNTKYTESKIEFPINIKCVKVAEDQWIGAASVKFLMALRKAQMINYNVNAQRTMQRIIRKDKEIYKIMLNKSAISEIQTSLEEGTYIPNTITLNIPEDDNVDFEYDTESSTLVINQLKYFDISDGYHRYMAMCRESDNNPDFDYPIELRIVSFSDDRVKQFIYQEDQKTKMKKVDSDSMNMASLANIVLERLNRDTLFDLQGQINRNEGVINFGELAAIVDYFYFKQPVKKADRNIKIREVENELREKFNSLINADESWLKERHSFTQLMIAVYCFSNNIDAKETVKLVAKADKLNPVMFNNKRPRKVMVNEIEKLRK